CASSAALTLRPSCSIAEMRQAASPAACGAAMLVPPLISFPVSQRGTAEKATPGVTRSGLASSPPRELHQPSTSRAGGVPAWAGRAKAPGKTAPTERAKPAVGDLEAQELGPRRHAVEGRDVEQSVAGRDARDVRAMPAVVEDEVELGDAAGLVEVRRQGDRLRAERDRLAPLAVIVQRHFVLE